MATRTQESETGVLLVADDGELSRAGLVRKLRAPGYRAIVTRSVKDAIETISDLQLIDQSLYGLITAFRFPDGSGARIVRDFKRHYPHLPVVIVSDSEDESVGLWTNISGVEVRRTSAAIVELKLWLQQLSN